MTVPTITSAATTLRVTKIKRSQDQADRRDRHRDQVYVRHVAGVLKADAVLPM